MVDLLEIRYLTQEVLTKIDMYSKNAEELMMLTGMAESDFRELIQGKTNNGTARSFWQVEPKTTKDNFDNYLLSREPLLHKVQGACGLICHFKDYSLNDYSWLLTTNIAFAIAMARIKYWRCPKALPDKDDVYGMARYYKSVYNTNEGAADIDDVIADYYYMKEME